MDKKTLLNPSKFNYAFLLLSFLIEINPHTHSDLCAYECDKESKLSLILDKEQGIIVAV